jgi:hypothetical protein
VRPREVLLLPAYHLWYPRVRPNSWLPADRVAQTVRNQLQEGTPHWELGPRVLNEAHFQFRGGQQGRSNHLRTRYGETSVLRPRLW